MSVSLINRACTSVKKCTFTIFFTLVLHVSSFSNPSDEAFISVVESSNFIFVGRVIQWNASNIDAFIVGISAIVKIETVVSAVPQYQSSKGREITVLLADTIPIANGTSLTFFTAGWYYGNGLGVREIKNTFRALILSDLSRRLDDAKNILNERRLQAVLRSSNVILEGTVIEAGLNVVKDSINYGEHAPEFKGARIKITKIYKGSLQENTVLVYYPSSKDKFWVNSPKLKNGQRSVFLLKTKEDYPLLGKKELIVLSHRDVQSVNQLETIKKLINK